MSETRNVDAESVMRLLRDVIDEKDSVVAEGSIEGYGLMGALEEMLPHWKSHIADGQPRSVLATDLKALESKVREIRKVMEEALGIQSEASMMVSLDGGQTFEPAPEGVRVHYPDIMVDAEDENGELSFNFTPDGVITDLWVSREDHLDHNLGTSSQIIEDIQHGLVAGLN